MLLNLDKQISSIKLLIPNEFNQVVQTILDCTTINVDDQKLKTLINKKFLDSRGKKLRPLLLLLIAKAINPNTLTEELKHIYNKNYIKLAATIELIHNASLFHDDVLDNTSVRNNQTTTNAEIGNQYAILAGDFLYSKALQLMLQINNAKIGTTITNTTSLMAEGELFQLSQKYNFLLSEQDYFKIITYKTALLFAETFQLPGMLLGDNLNIHNELKQCGLNFGIAYQIIDDLSDYYLVNNELLTHNDLTEGKITLPIIFLLNNPNIEPKLKQKILNILNDYVYLKNNFNNNNNLILSKKFQFDLLKSYLLNYGCFDYAANIAKSHLNKVKDFIITFLAESKYRQAILQVVDHLLNKLLATNIDYSSQCNFSK